MHICKLQMAICNLQMHICKLKMEFCPYIERVSARDWEGFVAGLGKFPLPSFPKQSTYRFLSPRAQSRGLTKQQQAISKQEIKRKGFPAFG